MNFCIKNQIFLKVQGTGVLGGKFLTRYSTGNSNLHLQMYTFETTTKNVLILESNMQLKGG